MLPWLLLLVGLGYGWGHWEWSLKLYNPAGLGRVLAAWTLLHVGTMWRNAARDHDRGPVLFGRSVTPPPGLAHWGDAALVACVLLGASWEAVGAATLALLYSHPRTAWKGHPILGPAVNLIGYGVLTPLAGWQVLGVRSTPRAAAALVVVAVAMLGLTFVAQVFQEDEDRARGDHTLVATHGPAAAVRAARWCLGAVAAVALGMTVMGWLPRACLLASPVAVVLMWHMARWQRAPVEGGRSAAMRSFALMMAVAVVVVVAAFGDLVWDSIRGTPVSGLGTALVPRW
jgi:hypothetical protein